jgi:hypothetical protein
VANWNVEHKVIAHINCPKEWESEDDYSSHRPMLWLAATKSDKHITEFGCGEGSTHLLEKYCQQHNLRFNSYETNPDYANKYNSAEINDYDEINTFRHDFLFIDSAPGEQRKYLIEKHKESAGVIVVHDTEEGAQNIYGIRGVLNSFKYRLDYYPKGNPGTTALSDNIDVTQWINQD